MDSMSKIVDTSKWENMEGDTEEIKKINSYLTDTLIFNPAPSDECLYLAKRIVVSTNSKESIIPLLRDSFDRHSTFDANGDSYEIPGYAKPFADWDIVSSKIISIRQDCAMNGIVNLGEELSNDG